MMKNNYGIVLLISFSLLLLTIGSSIADYTISMKSTQKQLKTQALPLSIDNIYTSIQKHVIEPYLVSSMMANDTFVKDWLMHNEKDVSKITKYLESIKQKNGMLLSFLVSQKSKNYYTQDGIIDTITKENPQNAWYFKFKNQEEASEINLDWNGNITDKLIMFINFKILDDNYNYLGATGVGIQISYIKDMLEMFRDDYKLKVYFVDDNGFVLLSQNHTHNDMKNIQSIKRFKNLKNKILSKTNHILEYETQGVEYLLSTKYIKELNIHLLVEAKLSDFTKEARYNFYLNMAISLLLTLIVSVLIISIIKSYHKKLAYLADHDELTDIPNRRYFSSKFTHFLKLSKRNKQALSLVFVDLDDFKKINDKYGHTIGDMVLSEFTSLIKLSIRETDLCARWGGEEFVISFINADINIAIDLTNKLKERVINSPELNKLLDEPLTISCGVTQSHKEDTLDKIVFRADKAMYEAKNSGKNRIVKI